MRFANLLTQGMAPKTNPPQGFGGLFPAQTMSQPQTDPGQSPPQNGDLNTIAQIFGHPNTTQFDNLSNLVGNIPQRSDFKPPSGLQSILQGITALGSNVGPAGMWGGNPVGIKANPMGAFADRQYLKDEPYNQAIGDFKTKEEPLAKLAQMESTRNTTDRTIANNILSQKLGQDKLDETTRNDNLKDKQKEDDRKIRQQRADAYEYKVNHPNSIIKEDNQGYFISVDPQTNQTEYLLDKEGDPIKSSNLDERAKLNIMHQNRMGEIAATGANAIKTKATPSGTPPSVRQPTETDKKTGLLNKANQAINEHPDWAPYIHMMQGGTFRVAAPDSSGALYGLMKGRDTSGDAKTLNDINQYIYGTQQLKPMSSHNSVNNDPLGIRR